MVYQGSRVRVPLLLNNIPLCNICPLGHLWKHIWVSSSFSMTTNGHYEHLEDGLHLAQSWDCDC